MPEAKAARHAEQGHLIVAAHSDLAVEDGVRATTRSAGGAQRCPAAIEYRRRVRQMRQLEKPEAGRLHAATGIIMNAMLRQWPFASGAQPRLDAAVLSKKRSRSFRIQQHRLQASICALRCGPCEQPAFMNGHKAFHLSARWAGRAHQAALGVEKCRASDWRRSARWRACQKQRGRYREQHLARRWSGSLPGTPRVMTK